MTHSRRLRVDLLNLPRGTNLALKLHLFPANPCDQRTAAPFPGMTTAGKQRPLAAAREAKPSHICRQLRRAPLTAAAMVAMAVVGTAEDVAEVAAHGHAARDAVRDVQIDDLGRQGRGDVDPVRHGLGRVAGRDLDVEQDGRREAVGRGRGRFAEVTQAVSNPTAQAMSTSLKSVLDGEDDQTIEALSNALDETPAQTKNNRRARILAWIGLGWLGSS